MAVARVASSLLFACVALCGVTGAATDTHQPAGCHGVLVAPQRALVTAQCAQQASVVAFVTNNSSSETVVIQRIQGDLGSVHGLLTSDAGIALSAFTVVDLESPVDVHSVLVQLGTTTAEMKALAPSGLLQGFSLQESDLRLSSDPAQLVVVNSFNASVVSTQRCGEGQQGRLSLVARDATVVCIQEQWSNMESCASSASHERMVAGVVQSRTYVYGFIASESSSLASSSAACSSSGSRTTLVHLVTADLVAHVQPALSGVKLENVSSASSAIIDPRSSITVVSNSTTLPDLLPEFTNSSSSNESTEEAVEAPVGSLQSLLPHNYALLSSSSDASAGAFAVAALIAPRFLVANTEWWASSIVEKDSSLWASFSDNKRVSVRRVWLESEFYAHQLINNNFLCDQDKRACPLVVFELKRAVQSATTTPFTIASSSPPLGKDLADTQLSVHDLAFLRKGQRVQGFSSFAIEDQSVCSGDHSRVVPGLQCLDSTDPIEISASLPTAPFRTSFATSGKDMSVLIGLSTGDEMQPQLRKHVSQAIIELPAAHHRQFLDSVTSYSVKWSSIEPAEDESYSNAKSTLLSFYDGRNAIECGGVAIAPKYILTTASCALNHTISAFSVGQNSSKRNNRVERVEIENAFEVISHPMYSSSEPLSRYNLALIELKTATLNVYMDLDNEARGTGARVSRMETTASDSWRPEKVQTSASCAALGSNAELNGLVCTRLVTPNIVNTVYNARNQLLPASRSSLLLHKTARGLLLVGLELSAPTIDPELSVYVSVRAAKQFVKAYTTGYSYGPRTQGQEFSQLPGSSSKIGSKGSDTALLDSQRYVVGLRVSKAGHNFCGGSLIAPTTVLTAAHCVTDGLANWVAVGSSVSSGTANAELIKVQSARVHPLYGSPGAYSYDAAILELAVGAYAPTVALDSSVDFADSVTGTMFGYGVEDSSDTLSSSVHMLTLQLWSRASCAKVLPDVDSSFLCAGGKANDDACSGDSGSPLIVKGRDGKDYLAGLVSAGYGCGIEGVPGLYTRTFAVAAFINAYVVQPSWRYPGAAGWASGGQADTTGARQSPPGTLKPMQDAESQSHFPKLEPRTSAGSTLSDIEDREATENVPVTVSPAIRTSSIAAAALAYQSALSKVALRDDLSASVKRAVLDYVLGTYDHTIVSGALLKRMLDVTNEVSFYSSGDLDALVAAIERHDALPLSRRKNRFGTMGQTPTAEDGALKRCSGAV